MKKLLWAASAALLLFSVPAAAQTAPSASPQIKVYGQSFENNQLYSPARLPVVMRDKKELNNFQMIGYISEVCQKEGCWMKLSSGKNSMDDVMVKMKDHAFLVPKDVVGKRALVHGTITKEMISVEEQKHYLEDAGASQAEINKITAPKEGYVFIADGVKIVE